MEIKNELKATFGGSVICTKDTASTKALRQNMPDVFKK